MDDIIGGKGDVSIVELRITRMPAFEGKMEIIYIPEEYFPPPPLTFTIGVMKDAKDRALADDYVSFITRAKASPFSSAAASFRPSPTRAANSLINLG